VIRRLAPAGLAVLLLLFSSAPALAQNETTTERALQFQDVPDTLSSVPRTPDCALRVTTGVVGGESLDAGPAGVLGVAMVSMMHAKRRAHYRAALPDAVSPAWQMDRATISSQFFPLMTKPVRVFDMRAESPSKDGKLPGSDMPCQGDLIVERVEMTSTATWSGLVVTFSYSAHSDKAEAPVVLKHKRFETKLALFDESKGESYVKNDLASAFEACLTEFLQEFGHFT